MQMFIPQNQAKGCIVPDFIFTHSELSNGSKMLYTILCSYARARNFCYPSKRTLSTKLNCSINTLKSWLKQLISYRFIKIENTDKGEHFYLFSPNQIEKKFNDVSSEIDEEPSKIDTKVNIKNFNIKTPYIPQKNIMQKKHKGWDNYKINQEFEKLWEQYPRKEAKEPARNIWFAMYRKGKLPTFEELKSAIKTFYSTSAWQREQGRFIPQLINFLRGMRWQDVKIPKIQAKVQPVYSPIVAPVYQHGQQKTKDSTVNRFEIDNEFSRINSFFEPMNKVEECLAIVLFDELYLQEKVPIINQKQSITLVAFLKNSNKKDNLWKTTK